MARSFEHSINIDEVFETYLEGLISFMYFHVLFNNQESSYKIT